MLVALATPRRTSDAASRTERSVSIQRHMSVAVVPSHTNWARLGNEAQATRTGSLSTWRAYSRERQPTRARASKRTSPVATVRPFRAKRTRLRRLRRAMIRRSARGGWTVARSRVNCTAVGPEALRCSSSTIRTPPISPAANPSRNVSECAFPCVASLRLTRRTLRPRQIRPTGARRRHYVEGPRCWRPPERLGQTHPPSTLCQLSANEVLGRIDTATL